MRAPIWALAAALTLPLAAQRGLVSAVSVPKSPVEAGTPVDITVTGSNPCGAVRLDYGDGTERITHPITQVPTTIRYVYKEPGRYEIRAEGMGNCDGVAATAIQVVQREPAPRDIEPAERIRFREMDDNRDGVISRAEWRGSPRAFRVHDANGDGILSGDELRGERGGRQNEVVVKATERWTDTGIYVREGELLRIESTGTVQLSDDRSDTSGPDGAFSGRRAQSAPLSSRPAGALIARIDHASPLFVGNAQTLRAPANGRLYLGVNDDYLADNRGEFRVLVDVEPRGRL